MHGRPLGLRRSDCTSVVLDGRVSVHSPETRAVHTLDRTATSVWHLLDGRRTLDEVVDEVAVGRTSPRADVEADVLSAVTALRHHGLLAPEPEA